MIISDYELVNQFDLLFQEEIILYTTGSGAHTAYRYLSMLNLQPLYFCDSNPDLFGKRLHGLKIHDPGTMIRYSKKNKFLLILCTTTYIDEIIQLIGHRLNDENVKVITLCGFVMAMRHNFLHKKMTEEVRTELRQINQTANINLTLFKQYMFDLKLSMAANSEVPLLIYQPGKVGSSSILSSVQKDYPMAVQPHRLNSDDTHWFESTFYPEYSGHSLFESFKTGYKDTYTKLISRLKQKKKIKIISLVREPLIRDLSAYFQFIRQQYNTIIEAPCLYEGGEISLLKDSKKYFQYILENFRGKCNWFFNEFGWFHDEFENNLGINIYDYPFEQEAGYTIIKRDNMEILLLKTEYLNSLETVIGDFLEIPSFQLVKSNDSIEKIYRFLYKDCKKNVQFPREYVDYKNNKYMDHFYSEKEKQQFLEKWEHHIAD